MNVRRIADNAIESINRERVLTGHSKLSCHQEEMVRAFYEEKERDLENMPWYNQLSVNDRQALESLVIGKSDRNYPVCSMNLNNGGAKEMSEKQQVDNLRGLGYDKIVDDGLSKGLSAGDIAINILEAKSKDEAERKQAIGYMANYAKQLRQLK